ncbi:HEAT repeat domain-containing protein [Acanthopleuribacter pedis]|uniref:Uncharacterized protein n=1 Tax=Acanthopleuribacter pedis TaxID=442870 RepID=A0A8J7Q0Y0_9BACT|nr:hypothetical protein [Acanthopleuribacter pedis]MBO1318382.1 hypothetical protein [Acanthopleuribacter pedis]
MFLFFSLSAATHPVFQQPLTTADTTMVLIVFAATMAGLTLVIGFKQLYNNRLAHSFKRIYPGTNPENGWKLEVNDSYTLTLLLETDSSGLHANNTLVYRVAFREPQSFGFTLTPTKGDDDPNTFDLLNKHLRQKDPYTPWVYRYQGDHQILLQTLGPHLALFEPWLTFEIHDTHLIFRLHGAGALHQTRMQQDQAIIMELVDYLLHQKPKLEVIGRYLEGEHPQPLLQAMFRTMCEHHQPEQVRETLGDALVESQNPFGHLLKLYCGMPVSNAGIRHALVHDHHQTRLATLDMLAKRDDYPLHLLLHTTLGNPIMFQALLDRLGEQQEPACIPHLIALFHRNHYRPEILSAIIREDHEGVRHFLFDVLESGDKDEQVTAVRHLRAIGQRDSLAPLRAAVPEAGGTLKRELNETLDVLSAKFPAHEHAGSLTPVSEPSQGALSPTPPTTGALNQANNPNPTA